MTETLTNMKQDAILTKSEPIEFKHKGYIQIKKTMVFELKKNLMKAEEK